LGLCREKKSMWKTFVLRNIKKWSLVVCIIKQY
jgi:hypothetical protein